MILQLLIQFLVAVLITGPAMAEELCGIARVTAGNSCRNLRLSYDLKACDDQAKQSPKIACGSGSADSLLRTEKASYYSVIREIAPGVWATIGQLRKYPRDWQMPALPSSTQYGTATGQKTKDSVSSSPQTGTLNSPALSMGAEFRLRWQRESLPSSLNILLLRAQPNFFFRPSQDLTFTFQPTVFSRYGDTVGDAYSSLGVYQAHLDWTLAPYLRARIGKQVLHFGNGWLLGTSDWENSRRSFDAARAVFEQEFFTAEAFYARAGSFSSTPATNEERHLVGFDFNIQLGDFELNPFALWIQEATSHRWSQSTLALQGRVESSSLDFHIRSAWQAGLAQAFAFNSSLDFLAEDSVISKLGAEVFWATRDFQAFYGVPHNLLGLTDTVGRRNALGLGLSTALAVGEGELKFEGFLFGRTDTALPAYREDSVTAFGSEYLSTERIVGTELNMAYSKTFGLVECGVEAGVFFPGKFLTDQRLDQTLYRTLLTVETRF